MRKLYQRINDGDQDGPDRQSVLVAHEEKVMVRSLVAIKANAALTDHLNIVSETMNLTTIGYIVTHW